MGMRAALESGRVPISLTRLQVLHEVAVAFPLFT